MSELKQGTAAWWNAQIEERVKGLRKLWLDDADKVVAKYEAEDRSTENAVFNILYSNTETLLPALYNSTPRPDVSRRYTTSTPERRLDSAIGQVAERLLEYSEDSYTTDYEPFDREVRAAVLHALVPGMGQIRVRMQNDEGHQELVYDALAYDRFLWSYARKWCDVTWVGFGYDLNQEGFETQFPKFCKTSDYKKWAVGGWKALKDKFNQDPTSLPRDWETGQRLQPAIIVWEVWNHEKREIKFVCSEFHDEFLNEDKYPFDMVTRFPCPAPLVLMKRNNNLTPKPPYQMYQDQDRELQEVSRRFLRVVKAVRVRGAYDARLTELEKIFGQDSDNALIPMEGASSLGDGASLDKAIWLVPVDTLIEVATKLAEAREQIKQTIYEITGIGDILRGQGDADETAAGATIKNSWGTLRLKRMQNDVSYFCRDLFRIGFEFMANLYSPATIKDITKLEYLFQAEKMSYQKAMAQYQLKMQQMQQMQQQAAQIGQQSGQPPPQAQPPPPPPVPPEKLAMMDFPTWEEIVGVMKDKFERTYRIDIETNSTIDLEATEDKQSMAEFMTAFGQMAAGLQTMAETGLLPFDAIKEVTGELLRRYRFGRRVEQALEMAKAPQGNGGAQQAAQAAKDEAAKAQLAGAQAQTQQVREQLERERSGFARKETELVSALEKKEIELTTARGTATIEGKLNEHAMAQKDTAHATEKMGLQNQVASNQRNVEMERLNSARSGLQGEQALSERDGQIRDLHSGMQQREHEHKLALGSRDMEMGNVKAQHSGELQKHELAGQKREVEHGLSGLKEKMGAATKPQPRPEHEAKEALNEHVKALKGLVEHMSAPRETTIEVGPDGKKRGISKVMKDSK